MRQRKDGMGVVFDLWDDTFSRFLEIYEHLAKSDSTIDFEVVKCTGLPELHEESGFESGGSAWRGNQSNGDGGYGKKAGGYGGSGNDGGYGNRGNKGGNGGGYDRGFGGGGGGYQQKNGGYDNRQQNYDQSESYSTGGAGGGWRDQAEAKEPAQKQSWGGAQESSGTIIFQ